MLSDKLIHKILHTVGRILVSSWYYYSVAIGITSHRLDLRTCTLHRSKCLAYYCVCVNTLTLLFLPVYCYCARDYMDIFVDKPLLRFIAHVTVSLQAISMVYTIGMRYRRDRRFFGIVQQLQSLDAEYFANLQPDFGNTYEWLLLAKYAAFCYQSFRVIFSYSAIMTLRRIDWLDQMLHLYFITIWNFLHSTVLFYFVVVLHICKRFHMLNWNLQQLLHCQQMQHAALNSVQLDVSFLDQLRSLIRIHRLLRKLLTELNDLFGVHLLILLVVDVLGISTMCYVTFVLVSMPAFEQVLSLSLISLVAYLAYNCDILLLNICCGRATRMHAEIVRVFRESSYIKTADETVQRTCENFILDVAAVDSHIRICGMITLDKRSALVIIQSSLLHTIILIQFDYMLRK